MMRRPGLLLLFLFFCSCLTGQAVYGPVDSRDARLSFFSGHTSTVATMSFLSARLYTDLRPGNKGDALAWATASAIPALTGYLRVKGGKHYLTDVLVGYAVGAAIGLVVPRLHR